MVAEYKFNFLGVNVGADRTDPVGQPWGGTQVLMLASGESGKGPTAEWICTQMARSTATPFPTAEVAAFGDGANDVELFETVGWSCAPSNGEPEAKAGAYCTPPLRCRDDYGSTSRTAVP